MARRLGPYSLLRQIASGGMAEIYLASADGDDGSERRVALKLIHAHSADDPELVSMLVEEARLALQLQHPNIVATYDLGHEGGEYYIVMELVEGMDLFRSLQRAAERDIDFPFELAAFIAREVAGGLDYAHRKLDDRGQPLHVVHRDVSPHNVLLSYAGEVKLGDFGIAKAARRAAQTQAGVIKGKYAYMSPEQAWGDPIDARTDIFSAGIILYEMLAGQMLYLEEDLERLLELVRKAEIATPGTRRKGVPRDLEQIVMKALRKRPSDRWPTAGDYAQALTDFLRGYAPAFNGQQQLGAFLERLATTKEAPRRRNPDEPTTALPRPRSFGGPLVKDDNSLLFPAPGRPARPAEDDEFGGATYVDDGPAAFLEMARGMNRLDVEEDRLGAEPTSLIDDLPGVPVAAGRRPSPAPRAAVPRVSSPAPASVRPGGQGGPVNKVLSPAPAPFVPRGPSPVPAAPKVLSPAPTPAAPRGPGPAGGKAPSAAPQPVGPSPSVGTRAPAGRRPSEAPQTIGPSPSVGIRAPGARRQTVPPEAPQAVGPSPSVGTRAPRGRQTMPPEAPQAGQSPSTGDVASRAPAAAPSVSGPPAPRGASVAPSAAAAQPGHQPPQTPPSAAAQPGQQPPPPSAAATPSQRPSAAAATPLRPPASPPDSAATPLRPPASPASAETPLRPPSTPPVAAQRPTPAPPASRPPAGTAEPVAPRPSAPPRAAAPAPPPVAAPVPEATSLRPRRGGLFLVFVLAMALGAGGVLAVVLWPQAPQRGQLEVRSAPPGATVLIDGRLIETPTPVRILDVDARAVHRVTVRQAGYRTWETEVRFEGAERSRAVQAILDRE